MRELNIEFQEQYKSLDKLCKEMYGSGEGVSAYIRDMEYTPYSEQKTVYNWDNVYKQLKHYRWMRNQLAHEIDIDAEFCERSDIDWIKNFRKCLFDGDDPLAVAHRAKTKPIQHTYSPATNSNIPSPACENKRYTLATRGLGMESVIVTGIMSVLMIVWACLTEDKLLLFIPLVFLAVCFICFIAFLFKYITEPKIAIQADCNGIYFYYRNRKEIFIEYADIKEIDNYRIHGSGGSTVNKSGIVISTEIDKYRSIGIKQSSADILTVIKKLIVTDDKDDYLMRIEQNNRQ